MLNIRIGRPPQSPSGVPPSSTRRSNSACSQPIPTACLTTPTHAWRFGGFGSHSRTPTVASAPPRWWPRTASPWPTTGFLRPKYTASVHRRSNCRPHRGRNPPGSAPQIACPARRWSPSRTRFRSGIPHPTPARLYWCRSRPRQSGSDLTISLRARTIRHFHPLQESRWLTFRGGGKMSHPVST